MFSLSMTDDNNPFTARLSELKQTEPLQVEENAEYGAVLKLLREKNVGAVVVCRKGKATGIITERDILNKYILEDVAPATPISKLMTRDPIVVSSEATVLEAIALMHKSHVRSLPIVDAEGRPTGVLTVGRVVRHLAAHFPAEVVNLPPKPSQMTQEVEGA